MMWRLIHDTFRACVALTVLGVGVAAQFPITETDQLEPGQGQFAGFSVALHGDVAFVGAPAGQFVGSNRYVHAYRLVSDQWQLEQTLTPPDSGNTRFGFALDFDGTTLVVGSPQLPSGGPGRAAVYTYDGASWTGTDLSYPPSPGSQIGFGLAVAVDGDSLLVGAPLRDVTVVGASGEGVGSVYAYRLTSEGTWKIKQQITPSNPSVNLGFGIAVDVQGFDALIGTGNGDRAHAFEFNFGPLWTETQVLTPSVATASSAFGESLSMSGDRAIIGAWQDTSFADGGAAFVFERVCGEWFERQRLDAPPSALTFGRAVGISGDAVVVGAQSEVVGGKVMAGAAYAYRWDGVVWSLEQRMTAASPATNEQVGRNLVMSGDRALISAHTASASGGSAYSFDAVPVQGPWVNLGNALAGFGTAELRGLGTMVPGAPLQLSTDCGLAGSSGVLIVGLDEINVPFKGGVLVPEPLSLISISFDGSGQSLLSTTWPVGIPAGTTVALQSWFFDINGPMGLSASNGLRATAIQ